MRKTIFSALVLSGVIANAQNDYYGRMGINTETPRATLEVKATSHNKAQGILFPTVTETVKNKWAKDNAKGLVAGTVVWNETKKCLDYFDGTNWICTDGTKKNVHGTDWDGTNTGGGSGSGSGSGTGSLGTSLPAEIVVSNGSHWIASIDDNNYLPFTVPASTDTASWTRRSNPNTAGTDTAINVQGKIPVAGITVSIPVTVTGTGSYQLPAYSYEISTVAEAWKDNTAKTLVLSWTAQTLTSTNKTITATLKVKGATTDQNLTQLDLREGLGGDYKGILLGQFKMPKNSTEATNSANWTATYDVRVISGIPDRNIGQADQKHDFLYLPVTAEDGKVWLNNNLGAAYANMRDTVNFNPSQQATSRSDHKAFGSLFQWQRQADGHELITWKFENNNYNNYYNSIKSNSVSGTINADWVAPANDTNFYYNDSSPYSWVSSTYNNSNHTYWQSGGKNNPCPSGFHVPTNTEWADLQTKSGGSRNYDWWAQTSTLKLPSAGWRVNDYDGVISHQGANGYYWSSEAVRTIYNSYYFILLDHGSVTGTYDNRAQGMSVRCLQD